MGTWEAVSVGSVERRTCLYSGQTANNEPLMSVRESFIIHVWLIIRLILIDSDKTKKRFVLK